MNFFEALLGVFAVLMLVPATVFFVQVLMAFPAYRPRPLPQGGRPTVCLLIPAHNEAAVIATTLRSITPQLAEGDRLLVVADNCSDETASIARELGAEVIMRTNIEHRGKGYALDFGIHHMRESPAEVVIIVDADCEVHPGAIDRLARTCNQAMCPMQALDLMLSPAGAGLKTRIAEFAWLVKNQVRPLGYRRLGLPCQLMGTGMAFPWALLSQARLANADIVEDMKLGIDLAVKGFPAIFCPEARVTSSFPDGKQAQATQRARWEHGHLSMILQEFPRLLAKAVIKGDIRLLGLALDLAVPPLALLVILLSIVFAFALAGMGMGLSTWPFLLASIALGLLLTAVLLAWYGWGRQVISFVDLLTAPFYVLAKIPLYLKFWTHRQKAWVKTNRDKSGQIGTNREAMNDLDRNIHCLLGLPLDAVNMAGAVRQIRLAAAQKIPCFLSTPNLNFLIACQADAGFRDAVINSDLSVADGMPLVWIARLLGIPIRERVAGSDLFEQLKKNTGAPLSVYFFGGVKNVAEIACQNLNAKRTGLVCAGYTSPGFGSVEDMSSDGNIAAINASGADFLVVSLGAKKGQAWIERNRARIGAPVISHLGAVVNFVAGTVSRAPLWMQRCGLEWVWRIVQERGLWRRYFNDIRALLRLTVTQVLPYALYLRRHSPTQTELATATVEIKERAQTIVLYCHGAWSARNIDRLRPSFKQAVARNCDIELNLEQVTHVDSAFLGLVMLLSKHQQKKKKQLNITGLSKAIEKIFRWNSAEFLYHPSN